MAKMKRIQKVKREFSMYDYTVEDIDVSNDRFILVYEDDNAFGGFKEVICNGADAVEEFLTVSPTSNVFNMTRQVWAQFE